VTVTVPRTGIRVGEALQATAVLRDAGGVIVTRPITWSSSAPAVATVSATGVITSLTPGGATITATSEGKSGTVGMTVTLRPVATVDVTLPRPILRTGTTETAIAVPRDSAGLALTGRAISWGTSSPLVATVTSAGVVTAVGAGTATISAISEGRTGSAGLTVTVRPVASMTVSLGSPADTILTRTRTTQASVVQRDSTGAVLVGRAVTWSIAPGAVAAINATGLITGVGQGSATATVVSDSVDGSPRATGAVSLFVTPVATVTVTTPGPSVRVGQTLQLTATARDVNAVVVTGRPVSWTSSNPAVATVSPTGLVTGVAVGAFSITASVDGRSASTALTVIP
jgi:uncharacterized protein YjdB